MKTRERIRFSIVIPCFNEEDYIGETLASLRAQDTQASFEIIVVDNNCSDNTSKIAAGYGAKVVSEAVPGVCPARQKGTIAAKGEIVVSTDADMHFTPDWLSKIDAAFKSEPALVAVCGPCLYYDGPWWSNIYTRVLFGCNYIYSRHIRSSVLSVGNKHSFQETGLVGL